MNLRETTGTTSESNRHRRPWKEGSRTPMVPLLDPERGTHLQMRMSVPVKYARAKADTNAGHEKARIINEGLRQWELMRQAKGDKMITPPKLLKIEAPIGATPETPVDEQFLHYWFTAYFRSTFTKFAKLEDVLEINRLAQLHGIDMNKAWRPWAGGPNAKKQPDTECGDPLKLAEERRQKKGIKRSDYLIDPTKDMSKPLSLTNSPEVENALRRRKA